jgi:vacuolar-type H+-ATPase subunit E/Vma4
MSSVLKQGPDALAALMAYVAQVRDRQLAGVGTAAATECRTLVAAARARARDQIRAALREVRADAEAQVAVARAGMQSRLRRRRQALTLAALADVQQRVGAALRARWQQPEARRQWMAMALAEAARTLPAGPWVVQHPPEAAPRANGELPAGVTLELRPDAALAAGVRIRAGDATLDATLAGLLRAPDRIAALWLGELERRRAP